MNSQKADSTQLPRMRHLPTSQRGFSLIELLIVVAIISIIAAVAIPYLERARQASKSASAVNSLRTINSSQASFRAAAGRYATLLELKNGNYIADPNLASGVKSGYTFDIASATTLNYEASADPSVDPSNLLQHYFVDGTSIIRVNVGAPATQTSNPIQ